MVCHLGSYYNTPVHCLCKSKGMLTGRAGELWILKYLQSSFKTSKLQTQTTGILIKMLSSQRRSCFNRGSWFIRRALMLPWLPTVIVKVIKNLIRTFQCIESDKHFTVFGTEPDSKAEPTRNPVKPWVQRECGEKMNIATIQSPFPLTQCLQGQS